MRFSIVNLGCKVNRVESDEVHAALASQGGVPSSLEDADLVVVNTCTVTGEADKKTRKAVRQALRANDRSAVVVTGCAAAIDPSFFAQLDSRVEVVLKNRLSERIPQLARSAHARIGEGFRTRVNVKIQDGCNRACTYCIVHVARGKATSAPVDDIVRQVTGYACSGAKEIVLTGINLGSYACGEVDLAHLLKLLLDETAEIRSPGEPAARFRVSSIEPQDVTDELIDAMAGARGRICRHLHLPLQSGSSSVLARMGRDYTADDFVALVERIRRRIPEIALSTDVIVGFPGETEAEFRETEAVVRACGFSRLHVFPYSIRKGTPAASMAGQVPEDVKRVRAKALRALSSELSSIDLERRAGVEELLLVEGESALSESYHELPAPPGARRGQLVCAAMPPVGCGAMLQ